MAWGCTTSQRHRPRVAVWHSRPRGSPKAFEAGSPWLACRQRHDRHRDNGPCARGCQTAEHASRFGRRCRNRRARRIDRPGWRRIPVAAAHGNISVCRPPGGDPQQGDEPGRRRCRVALQGRRRAVRRCGGTVADHRQSSRRQSSWRVAGSRMGDPPCVAHALSRPRRPAAAHCSRSSVWSRHRRGRRSVDRRRAGRHGGSCRFPDRDCCRLDGCRGRRTADPDTHSALRGRHQACRQPVTGRRVCRR